MTAPLSYPLGPIAPLPAATPAPTAPGADRAKIHKVATQFEAIFVRQILAEARKTSLDGGENSLLGKQDQTFREMQDARYADIAASKGTFGLSRMIEKQLLARSATPAKASALPPAPTTKTGG